jgi:hypothetical protein
MAGSDSGEAEARPEREGRSRRGRRGGRGRKRGERAEGREAGAAPAGAGEPGAAMVGELPLEVPSAAPAAQTDVVAGDAIAGAAAEAASGAPADARPARASRARAPRRDVDESIGVSGLRLTRDEAMGLVRDAVATLASDDDTVTDETVRRKVFDLLGRDSESLSVRNFSRILRDAHDSNIVDVRRRGDGFEVARSAEAASVADQLVEREEAAKAAAAPAEPAAPAPRGMGPRGAPARGRGRSASAAKTPPPELLLVGVVDDVATDRDEKPARRPRRSKPEDAAEE